MSQKFEVGDIVVCMDGSPYAGIAAFTSLEVGKAYEVRMAGASGDICLKDVDTGHWKRWKRERFRRATLDEIRKYRKEQGYEKHHFAVGDLVVCIAMEYSYGLSIGQIYKVSAVKIDSERECFVDLDDGNAPGRYFAANFRKATPAEVEAYRKDKEKMVTIQVGDSQPFTAVDVTPIQEKPKDTLDTEVSSAAGVDWASAEVGPSFSVTFTWEGPEKKPLSGNDSPEAINKAIAVPNPQMLTSSDGREFEIIDWNPKVCTGEVVTVKANLLPKLAQEKPFEVLKAAVAATEPVAPAWEPKTGDLVVCKDPEASENLLEAGKVYEVVAISTNVSPTRIVLNGPCDGVGRNYGFFLNRFRPATVSEISGYWRNKGFPNHQFNAGDVVVCVNTGPYTLGSVAGVHLEEGKAYLVERLRNDDVVIAGLWGWNRVRFRKATLAERIRFFNEKLDKEGPGDGYRLLGDDERIDESDEVFDAANGTWQRTIRVGEIAVGNIFGLNRYRRRNKFAEGELVQIVKPATQQERDRDPVWTSMMDRFDGLVFPMPTTEPITSERDGIHYADWAFASDWLAPATKAQKKAYDGKKAKIQELEDKMKDIQSELSSLKGT